ncbi:MAG: dephospho-CoA kinase [Rikenellaceae bacterium]
MIKVGVTGGIGSGKSTLCRHFRDSGVPHYDSDSRARALMNSDESLRERIIEAFGSESYNSYNELNRGFIAAEIFGDEAKLKLMNSIVHPAVMRDFEAWADGQDEATSPYVVLESAILFEAGLESNVDYTVAVLAPEQMRITRVVNRDGSTLDEVKARIAAQLSDDELHTRASYSVVNIFEEDLAGAAQRLDQIFKGIAFKNMATKNGVS